MWENFFKNKNVSKTLKLRLKNTTIDKTLTCAAETGTLTDRDRKQLNIFERKVHRRILGPVYDNEEEYCRLLTNKETYAIVKKPTIMDTVRLNRLRWFRHLQRMEENIGCPTCYRTRHFFNNSNTNEDMATKLEQEYVRCVRNKEECVYSVCLQCVSIVCVYSVWL